MKWTDLILYNSEWLSMLGGIITIIAGIFTIVSYMKQKKRKDKSQIYNSFDIKGSGNQVIQNPLGAQYGHNINITNGQNNAVFIVTMVFTILFLVFTMLMLVLPYMLHINTSIINNGNGDNTQITDNAKLMPTFEGYVSRKFDYQIEYPSHFISEGLNGQREEDDFLLTSKDKRATLILTARFFESEIPSNFTIQDFRRLYCGTEINHLKEIDTNGYGWYVISAKTNDGMMHYRKCIISEHLVRMFTFSTRRRFIFRFDHLVHALRL